MAKGNPDPYARPDGYVVYDGPSQLPGQGRRAIVGILTHVHSAPANPKIGGMAQLWILDRDTHPIDAMKTGKDAAVCGSCPLRPTERGSLSGRACYVNPLVIASVWRAYQAGNYMEGLPARIDVPVRIGAYGDPLALPIKVVRRVLARVSKLAVRAKAPTSYTGYTHAWRTVGARSPWRRYVMASCESAAVAGVAHAQGWRTFRLACPGETLPAGESWCPAKPLASGVYPVSCRTCLQCGGVGGGQAVRRSIAIAPHGNGTRGLLARMIPIAVV